MADIQHRAEQALDRCLPPATLAPARLHEAMRYATLGGGKRMRLLLCHAAGEALGADPGALDGAACAVRSESTRLNSSHRYISRMPSSA
jgi:farnesyl diphosphate synthase